MKAKSYRAIIGLMIALTMSLSSCKEFIEPSLKSSQVNVEAPANNFPSKSYTMNFWWDEVDNALYYRLQVVSPTFDSVATLIIDTLIKKNTFSLTLNPGQYQWHVRAENGSSQSPYSAARNFTVLYSSIKQQTEQLSAPANNSLTNQNPITLQWQSMYGATKYQLEIDTNNFVNESTVIYNQTLPGLQYTFTFPKSQNYQWRVKAENDTAQSQWSVVNQISYNTTPPAQATLSSPANKQTLSLPVQLQWNVTSKAARYKLYVLKSDSTSIYNATFPLSTSNTAYTFNLGNTGDKIYWKVSAVDAYGNEGQASTLRSFTLQ